MALLVTCLASRADASCVCHGAPKEHQLLAANPICIPYAAATVVRKNDPKEQTTELIQAGQKALGWVEADNLKEVVFEFRAEDLDLDTCEAGDGDVYAFLIANEANPPVVTIKRKLGGIETDLGSEAFKEKDGKWVATWKFKDGPGVYSFEFVGEIQDRYEDHPASDDPSDLDIRWFRSKLAVSLPIEVDIVSDSTDDYVPWNCSDPTKYADILTTLRPEGAVGAFTLKIMDGTTVVRTLVAGENRAGGTWTDRWNGLKDDGTPAAAKAYTVRADWVVPEGGPGEDEEYPLTVVKLDLGSDIDNDGDIDMDDEAVEEFGIGEVVRIDDIDDNPGGEDDLQYMEISLEPTTLGQGVVWLVYDNTKIKIWTSPARTPGTELSPGTKAGPNWNLKAGDTVPQRLYIQGLAATEKGNSIEIVVHWQEEGHEFVDRIVMTVTDHVGHYAYFAGIRDYLTEFRGEGANQYKLFECVIDAAGGQERDFRLVAVRLDQALMFVCDAFADQDNILKDIKAAKNVYSSAMIVANGTFFRMQDPNQSIGRLINNYQQTPSSSLMEAGDLPDVKTWFGQDKARNFVRGTPSALTPYSEPPVSSPPHGDTSIRASLGGIVSLMPPAPGKTLANTLDAIKDPIGDWNDRQSSLAGVADADKLFFLVCSYDAKSNHANPDVDFAKLVEDLSSSGAGWVIGLDGGSSVALAHRDRLGDNLAVATEGEKHTTPGLPQKYWVNNYLVVEILP